MELNATVVKELREKTGAGFMDCKKALAETGGNLEKAVDYLRQKGLAAAAKKADRVAADGAVGAYVHPGGKIGVLVEINCQTDFVARTTEFQTLLKDMAMQIAAASPRYRETGRGTRRRDRKGTGDLPPPGAGVWQAGKGDREDRRRKNGAILFRSLLVGTSVHQRSRS